MVITTFKSWFSVKKKVSAVITLFRTVCIWLSYKCKLSVLFYNASVFGKKSDSVCGVLVYFCAVLGFLDNVVVCHSYNYNMADKMA